MTNTPDTSPEAVGRLIVWLMDAHGTGNTEKNPEAWRTLEALSSALEAETARADAAEAERDQAILALASEAHARGEAEGRLAALKTPGRVDLWKRRDDAAAQEAAIRAITNAEDQQAKEILSAFLARHQKGTDT